jgi:hypothetical protein
VAASWPRTATGHRQGLYPETPAQYGWGYFMAAVHAFQKHRDRVCVAPEGFSEKALGSPLLGVIGTYFVLQ